MQKTYINFIKIIINTIKSLRDYEYPAESFEKSDFQGQKQGT